MTSPIALDDPWFDEVVRDHPLVARRLPVLRSCHARMRYDIALVVNPDDDLYGPSEEPTEAEAEQLLAYLEFRLRYYNDRWRQRMLDLYPFDLDETVNTYTFRKHVEAGWQYNVMTWRGGWPWFPARHIEGHQPMPSLEALLDHTKTFGAEPMQSWLDFKAESPAFLTGVDA